MTIRPTKFTPETLISSPRRSAGVPNGGDPLSVLYTVSSYSFKTRKETSELRVRNIQAETDTLIDDTGRASNPAWLDPGDKTRGGFVLYLRERDGEKHKSEKGMVDLVGYEVDGATGQYSRYVIGTFSGPVSNLKVTRVGSSYYGIAVTGTATPSGALYNSQTAPKPITTAKLYSSIYVRHWDHYVTPNRNSIFYAALLPHDNKSSTSKLFMTNLQNPLKSTGIECPMPPFGGADHFDISKTGITFVARDETVSPALHTRCLVHYIPLSNYLETTPEFMTVYFEKTLGAMTSPRFNADGSKVAFLAMPEDGYEADRNEIYVMKDVSRPAWISHLRASPEAKKNWDRSPDSVAWSADGDHLWVTAENWGRKELFRISSQEGETEEPERYTFGGSVHDVVPLADGRAFASGSTLIDSSGWGTWLPGGSVDARSQFNLLDSFTTHGRKLGLQSSQVHQLVVETATNPQGFVHAWEMRPSDFTPDKKYPLALLIHGGPQSAWDNAWSTRWNPAVFAEQGYVVIAPNPTGSTGYGQEYTDNIQGEWGGRPYQDIVSVFEHLKKKVSYIDTDRAVGLGASYGGYMMNWIQGQPLGRELKALVTHDGVFSTMYEIATDELYFINHEYRHGWNPKDKKSLEEWRRWDPSLFTDNWKTPQLVIHSENDYRLTMADGLAAFNILQSKGIESEFLTFNDETHFVLGKENSLRWHETVISFINRHVGLPKWEREEGDIDKIRQDPNSVTRGTEEGRARVQILRAEDETSLPLR